MNLGTVGPMMRCENCGKRNPDPICASCAHHKKKEALRAATEGAGTEKAPAQPAPPPDLDDLRERMRRIKDALAE